MLVAKCVCSLRLDNEHVVNLPPLLFSDLSDFEGRANLVKCSCGLVQKILSPEYVDELESSYRHYGKEINSTARITPLPVLEFGSKHELISNWIVQELREDNKEFPELLDWGCGNLDLLCKIKERTSERSIKLSGFDKFLKPIIKSQNFGIDFLESMSDSRSRDVLYDYVSAIHVLEHATNLPREIESILSVLKDDGKIFIQVPNLDANPYDIYVADHTHHFTSNSLSKTLEKQGIEILSLDSRISSKEISILARKGASSPAHIGKTDSSNSGNQGFDFSEEPKTIAFYESFANEWVRAIRGIENNKIIAIYGLGIAGAWMLKLCRELAREVSYFIDDNEQLSDFTFKGIPILDSRLFVNNEAISMVIIPFSNEVAREKGKNLWKIGVSSLFLNSTLNRVDVYTPS